MKESEREDALQLLTCSQPPWGGIGPSENQLLTCCKFLFTGLHKKSQHSSFYSISFNPNFISFSCLPTTALSSTHHPHPAGKPLLFCTNSHSIKPEKILLNPIIFGEVLFHPEIKSLQHRDTAGPCPHRHLHVSGKKKKRNTKIVIFPKLRAMQVEGKLCPGSQ